MSDFMIVSVDPARPSLMGQRWIVNITHANGNHLMRSERYRDKDYAEALADKLVALTPRQMRRKYQT